MKPENALPAYLYCKLLSTFQPRGEKYREDGTSRKSRREWKNLLSAEQHASSPEKTSKLQVKQTKTDPEIPKV